MLCEVCGAETEIERSRPTADGLQQNRTRMCKNPATPHTFRTVERAVGLSLEQVLVRRSGDGALRPFDRARLLQDVRDGILKRLDDNEVFLVVERSVLDVELRLATHSDPIAPKDRRTFPHAKAVVADATIRRAVEDQLRGLRNGMPHVLYALSTLGRRDHPNRPGFRDARDVLSWMGQEANYPGEGVARLPPDTHSPTDFWWPPSEAPRPRRVIKRDRSQRPDFAYNRFAGSIRRALLGRPQASVTSSNVAEWTLWEIAGQNDVLSSQLAVGVMSCLRRIDDIAYLRWAAIAKDMTDVADFRDEAVALVTHPSPRLRFRVQHMPRVMPRTSPGGDRSP